MDVSQTSEHTAQDSLDVSMDTFNNMIQLLSILGNEDAFSIFLYARNGFSSSKLAIIDLELSQKRFYTRLKDLIEIGLIEKEKGIYQHTSLGNIFFKTGLSLTDILEKKEKVGLFDPFKNTDSFSLEDYYNIKTMVSNGSTRINRILDLVFLSKDSNRIQVLPTQEKQVEKMITEINSAKIGVKYASKNLDLKIIDALIGSTNRGVKIRIISENFDFEDKLSKLQLILSPKLIMSLMEYFSSAEIGEQMRECEIPFSFCVLDENKCFFELSSLKESAFSISFFIIDEGIGSRFSLFHDEMWESSMKASIPNIFNND